MTVSGVIDQNNMLAGIRIIETATWLSGPAVGQALAHLGAEVIKVESPAGDPMRFIEPIRDGLSAHFANANHGKKSVVLDLSSQQGKNNFEDLLNSADGLVENWRSGVAERLGFGKTEVRSRHPSLVRLSITGYGEKGPVASSPAFDEIMQAHSGLATAQGDEGPPMTVRLSIADLVTANFGTQTLLAGLLARERGASGRDLSVSMLAAASYFNFNDLFAHRTFLGGEQLPRVALRSPVAATKDGFIVVVPGTRRQFRAALAIVDDPRAETFELTDVESYNYVFDNIGAQMVHDTTTNWLRRFGDADVPATAVRGLDEHLTDPQVEAEQIYEVIDEPSIGGMRRPRYPARPLSRESVSVAPRLGQHTDQVLSDLA